MELEKPIRLTKKGLPYKPKGGRRSKRIGYRIEHRVEKDLKERGFLDASKTVASLGAFDIVATIQEHKERFYNIEGLPISYHDLLSYGKIGVQAKRLRKYMNEKEAVEVIEDGKKRNILALICYGVPYTKDGKKTHLQYELPQTFLKGNSND